jgi:hypothetical protein
MRGVAMENPKDDKRLPLEYATQRNEAKRQSATPYVTFIGCAIPSTFALGIGLTGPGFPMNYIALLIGIFSGLCAIVLPILIQLRNDRSDV